MQYVLLAVSLVASAPRLVHVTIRGSIESSLSSLPSREASVLGAEVARLVRWRGDVVKNVHPGDDLSLLWEPGEEQPELVAMRYRGSELALSAYRFASDDGILRYWDENGRLVEPVLENPPLASYVQITETVQRGRGKRPHKGIDFKAPTGTPVLLPFDGTVTRVNWSRRVNGNCIEVEVADGRVLHFLHLSRVAVKAGAVLAAGARLGEVGSTGHSNAPHLHYEILGRGKRPLDPLVIHGTRTLTLGRARLASFEAARARYDSELGPHVASGTPVVPAGPRYPGAAPETCAGRTGP